MRLYWFNYIKSVYHHTNHNCYMIVRVFILVIILIIVIVIISVHINLNNTDTIVTMYFVIINIIYAHTNYYVYI